MYFSDFSEYGLLTYQGRSPYTLKEVFNIGWLEVSHSYQKGDVANRYIAKIKDLLCLQKTNINMTRGIHKCDFCGISQHLEYCGKEIILGMSELWIPSTSRDNIVFAAPTLIVHYIEIHNYQPPIEFLQAVDDFDLESLWDGNQVFETLKQKYRPT